MAERENLTKISKEILEDILEFHGYEIRRIEDWCKYLDDVNKDRFENILIRLWEIKKFTKDRFSNTLFLSLMFCLEGMINVFEEKLTMNNSETKKKLKDFLNSNVNEEDKKRLILAFTFDEKHICIQDSIKWQIEENKQYGIDELNFFSNCSPTDFLRRDSFESLCMCEYYLENCSVEEFEKHFYKLLDHFYEMRNSEVHRGFPITLDFKKYNNIQKLETVTFS